MKLQIGIIGGGNMGEAILKGIRSKYSVTVCEDRAARRRFLQKKYRVKVRSFTDTVRGSNVIILAVKPQDIDSVLAGISKLITKSQTVISIAAGITTQYIEKKIGHKVRVIRTMPNMPAQIGEGITAVAKGRFAKSADVAKAVDIFSCVGEVVRVSENQIDAVTAVSGSGPAYVFLFAECLLKAARSVGLSARQSHQLVTATLLGSAHQLVCQKEDAAELRARVTSKGGTTQAAMDVFFKRKTDQIFKDAVKAAQKRAKELSKR